METAQLPATTRKSGNTQLQEAPSRFEAEVMEEGAAWRITHFTLAAPLGQKLHVDDPAAWVDN